MREGGPTCHGTVFGSLPRVSDESTIVTRETATSAVIHQ
jgi:hypothetical protein